MLKRVCCAAAIFIAAVLSSVSNVSAQPISWFGGGVLTSVVNCNILNLPSAWQRSFGARYTHPNIINPANDVDSGPNAKMSFFFQNFATNVSQTDGTFPIKQFTGAKSSGIGSGAYSFKSKVKILKQNPDPASIDIDTKEIFIEGIIRDFAFPPPTECDVTFSMLVLRN